ncbi:hypothetical protein ACFLRW_05455 [Acidobacteriota bacterium]
MKRFGTIVLGIGLVLCFFLNLNAQRQQSEDILVFYYFGSTNIGFCTAVENIEKIKRIREELPLKDINIRMKFVLVCLDEDMETGLKFVKKYGQWDEISIGGAYRNELALNYLNTTEVPSIPHIIVFLNTITTGKWNIPILKKKKILIDLAGEKQIGDWIEQDYPLSLYKNSKAKTSKKYLTNKQ